MNPKSKQQLRERLEEFFSDITTEKRLDGNLAWTPIINFDDIDFDALMQAFERFYAGEVERWWISTAPLSTLHRKVLGPFESQELALDVRKYIEKVDAPETYWVDCEKGQSTERNKS